MFLNIVPKALASVGAVVVIPAGASLDGEDPAALLQSMSRFFKFLPPLRNYQINGFVGGPFVLFLQLGKAGFLRRVLVGAFCAGLVGAGLLWGPIS